MPAEEEQPEASNSGITIAADGQRHVAASVRADGSVRKEIKIRPGYRPPEDVEAYKNRTADAFRNRGKGPIPGSETIDDGEDTKDGSAASNRNAKRREARKRAKEKEKNELETADGATEGELKPDGDEMEEARVDPEAEKEKEAKKLAKKLRQARELKERKDKGDALLPEQIQKVIRISELIRQLDSLGFDANGERKAGAEET